MREITKVSDIVVEDIADYIRLSEVNQDDSNTLEALLTVAKSFIENYTGLSEESLNEKKDLIIVVLILCQDMYDNRTLSVDNNNLNKVVTTILNMNRTNLLPNVGDADD